MSDDNERQIRAYSILAKGDIPIMLNEEEFLVPSQTNGQKYKVIHLDGWNCECKDFKYRKQICKHIYTIQFWLKLRNGVSQNDIMEIENIVEDNGRCVYCKSSNIVKNGKIKDKTIEKQRFLCKDCKRTFLKDREFNRLKCDARVVTLAMDLYYKGNSLRDIADTIHQFYGVKINASTIYRWINKFMGIMNKYVSKFQPKVSDAWHVDEQMVKVKGKFLWNWNVLDENTRFLIANNITKSRFIKDARVVLKKAKETTKAKPEFVVTDGLPAYEKAIHKEFKTDLRRKDSVKHVRLENFEEKPNNNLIERYHSSFRERDKVMRGFKKKQSVDNFRTYYNFIRKHQGLNGLTPSEMANINLQLGNNRWLSLIKKSMENNGVKNDNR